ncbi:MAG: hypothetical protein ACJAYB_000093 [Psychromonas sp.]|jgi:hypothetical protein
MIRKNIKISGRKVKEFNKTQPEIHLTNEYINGRQVMPVIKQITVRDCLLPKIGVRCG